MYRMPYHNQNHYRQQPVPLMPPQKKKKWKFRNAWLYVPITTAILLFIIFNVDFAFSWDEIMEQLNVNDKEKYTKLCVLGLLCVGVAALSKILKDKEG